MRWLEINGFPNYEVSDTGLVRKKGGRLLKQSNANGYKIVGLFIGSKCTCRRVHRLVGQAFLPKPQNSEENLVAHNDGTRDNNNISNLRWATCKSNLADRIEHGTTLDGVRNGRAKLSVEQVMQIRVRYKKRDPINGAAAMAREFGVTDVAVIKAFRGSNWASIPF